MKEEGPYEASKWLKVPVLLEVAELEALLSELKVDSVFLPGIVCQEEEGIVQKKFFLQVYAQYLDQLKKGEIPDEKYFRKYFSAALTLADDHLYKIEVSPTEYVLRIAKPVIQLQFLKIDYSPLDQSFRTMVFGSNTIFWGLLFSYPQLFHDPKTKDAKEVKTHPEFPNTKLFHHVQKWIRQATIPTPFLIDEIQINAPIRLGKQCLSWINNHPQLKSKGIKVKV